MLVWLKALLLVGAPASFALGISLPLMRFESFYVFSTDASLSEVILSLWNGGDEALALLVGLVSIAFRLTATASFLDRLVPVMSKWSMMDVFLVAILIFATKTGGLAQAFTQPGLWFCAASSLFVVALSALGRRRDSRKAQNRQAGPGRFRMGLVKTFRAGRTGTKDTNGDTAEFW